MISPASFTSSTPIDQPQKAFLVAFILPPPRSPPENVPSAVTSTTTLRAATWMCRAVMTKSGTAFHQISWCMRKKLRPVRRIPNDGSTYSPSGVNRREKASESREFHPATQLRPTCSKFILLLLLRCHYTTSAYSLRLPPSLGINFLANQPPPNLE